MNPTATNLNQVNAAKSPSASAKPQTATTPNVPFSQVLSSEIKQNRSSAKAGDEGLTEGNSDAASASTDSTKTDTPPATQAANETDVSKLDAAHTTEAGNTLLNAQSVPGAPDVLLALAMQLDGLKAPTGKDSALSKNTTDASKIRFDIRKGATRPASPTTQGADETPDAKKIRLSLPSQAEVRVALGNTVPYGSVAAAFAGQLAAARQSDALKEGGQLPDIQTNPFLGTPAHALLDPAFPLNSVTANTLAPSVGTTAWGQALGDKIVWMTAGAQQTASLTLNPPNLGPLQIVLNLTNDQATASFFTAQPEVRQALEAAFPKLREMMNEVGIQLGQATVSMETPRQNDTPDRQAQRASIPFSAVPFSGIDAAVGIPSTPLPVRQSGRGLIDTFA